MFGLPRGFRGRHLPQRLRDRKWLDALERGLAAHHAGMLPAFKEIVEALFQRGLLKAVFATETLALGINMPARAVVLERLSPVHGEGHEVLSPGRFTQPKVRAFIDFLARELMDKGPDRW